MSRFSSTAENALREIQLTGNYSSSEEPAGFLGVFGNGLHKVFYDTSTFTIPVGVTKIRVRVIGSGSFGFLSRAGSYVVDASSEDITSGAGGGYAHGVFDVSSGQSYTVTIGNCGTILNPLTKATTTSFGSLISATGASSRVTNTGRLPEPGIGIGGDFQAYGGTSYARSGGGASGSQLGNGGNGLYQYTANATNLSNIGGGAAVGGFNSASSAGASSFGLGLIDQGGTLQETYNNFPAPDIYRRIFPDSLSSIAQTVPETSTLFLDYKSKFNHKVRFPFDGFVDGGGVGIRVPTAVSKFYVKSYLSGAGSGSIYTGGNPSNFNYSALLYGGGGGSMVISSVPICLMKGRIIGGGCGMVVSGTTKISASSDLTCQGLVIVEW